jgi:hypothetical protein
VLFPVEGTFCVDTEVKLAVVEFELIPLLVQVTINFHTTVVPKLGAVAV